MATMDVLKALDELKDAGVEERSARAMLRRPPTGASAEFAHEIHCFRVDVPKEIKALLDSFTAYLRAAVALHLGGTAFLLVVFHTLLR